MDWVPGRGSDSWVVGSIVSLEATVVKEVSVYMYMHDRLA